MIHIQKIQPTHPHKITSQNHNDQPNTPMHHLILMVQSAAVPPC